MRARAQTHTHTHTRTHTHTHTHTHRHTHTHACSRRHRSRTAALRASTRHPSAHRTGQALHISLRAYFATDPLNGNRDKNKRQLTAINGNSRLDRQPADPHRRAERPRRNLPDAHRHEGRCSRHSNRGGAPPIAKPALADAALRACVFAGGQRRAERRGADGAAHGR